MSHIGIMGTGAWGTALALSAYRADNHVTLLGRSQDIIEMLHSGRVNTPYLPDIMIPEEISVTADITVTSSFDFLLLVVPAQTVIENCLKIKPYIKKDTPIIICSKGIEQQEPHRLLSDCVSSVLPNPIAILSGPNFAIEVAQNLPAATCVASTPLYLAQKIADKLRHSHFRIYVSDDPVGVQIAGALKNVIAIACGVAKGCLLGQNAVAALITRGLAEMRRLAVAMGGQPETFLGLAGVGDLMLTCTSETSRNTSLGIALSQGQKLDHFLASRRAISEGVYTTQAIMALAQKYNVMMPISSAMYDILYKNRDVTDTIEEMLSRQISTTDV